MNRANLTRRRRQVKAVARSATFQVQAFVITLWALQFIGLVLLLNK